MNVHDTPGKAATLTVNGKDPQLPVRSGTIGPDVIDVTRLYRETGCFTYDPGFTSTANCEFEDHLYRWRRRACCSIAATRSTNWRRASNFLEICYLLLHGELPNKAAVRGIRAARSRATRWCTSR